jgi:hypothetical protein
VEESAPKNNESEEINSKAKSMKCFGLKGASPFTKNFPFPRQFPYCSPALFFSIAAFEP